ncbi:hypothetical protein EP1X_03895 [Thermococcus sp. EP1]|uniref:hypothetical protein n=1 Tax=Thermococcus sp. EP1 TaxID=1591054 RepID=UPI0006DB6133|nr:hypothetical protein [Thermococcus sp. EP1]KPU63489.1 hypothetical protein EP1X_03895 [Thermococcus sp. EP1]
MQKEFFFAFGISLVLVLAGFYYTTHDSKRSFWQTVDTAEFYLKDNSTDSIFTGTVFAQTNGALKRVILVGWVNITKLDFAGALVGVPHGWRLTSAGTSYKDRNITSISDWMNILVTEDPQSPVRYRVFIGPAGHDISFCIEHSCAGGMGTIFLELVPEEGFKNLTLTLGVGSGFKVLDEGRKVLAVATTSKNITIRFS